MDILNKTKAEKFRILKDPELKEILGGDGGCEGTTSCGGGCSGMSIKWDYTPLNETPIPGGWQYLEGQCYYSSIARQCVCG